MHLHPDRYTFSYVIDGGANLICKDTVFKLKSNDLVVIPPFVAHQTMIDHFFHYKVIRVPKSNPFINVSNNQLGLTIIQNGFSYKAHFNNWFESIRNNLNISNEDVCNNVPEVFQRFLIDNAGGNSKSRAILKKSLKLFEHNYNRPILVEELSDITCMSDSHFQRLFKSNIGISPMRYLLNLRIEKAKEYIKNKDSFTEVAYETGFYDQSHFNKYFKINVGMIPKRYADFIK